MTPPMGTRRRPAPVQQQQQATHELETGSNTNSNPTSMARPPPIHTRGSSFGSASTAAATIAVSGTSQRNEVVIDGESSATDSEEEEDVMVITPQSRKRNRTSAIMDDDDEEEEEVKRGEETGGSSARTTPLANKRFYLSPGPRDTSSARQSVARTGDIISTNDDDGDDDDEVEIVQMGSAAKPLDGSASKKNRRLTIEDSDDENDQAASQERIVDPTLTTSRFENTPTPSRRRSSIGTNGGTPTDGITPGSNASSSRRSSRIERKRQEKESESSSVRKLNYLSLDNCLDSIEKTVKKGKVHADGTDEDEDDDDDFEEEEEEVVAPVKCRRLARETEREVLHADGDDDLDEFIVDDNEIEYMDDDENGVISVESGSEDDDDIEEYNEADEFAAHRAAQQTRERDEWFTIYMEYIEESIIDADLDNKMRRRQGSPQYQLYREAIFHIERELCSRRDNLRGNVVWPEDMLSALKSASSFRSSHCDADYECEACNRTNHMATYVVQLGGVTCDASELYRENWMQRLRKNMLQAKAVNATFQMGSVCHARTLAYWQLLHAKRFWCILVDAKRKECSDATGRIAAQFRTQLNKQEFSRYKRLLTLVETFETEARQSHATMSNVWKKITPQQYKSDFLPRRKGGDQQQRGVSRRGMMDSFVAESEDEDEDDGDEEVDQEVEHVKDNAVVNADADDDDDDESEVEQKDNNVHMGGPSRRSREDKTSTSKITAFFAPTTTSSTSSKPETAPKSDHESSNSVKKAPDEGTETEDLLCLVCGENPRNGGIMHGQYLHFYCCFRCGKRQFRANMGCLVCDRPIDKVLRLLPLTAEMRKAIKEHK